MGDERSHEATPPEPVSERKVRSLDNVSIDELLHLLLRQKASDLHVAVGLPPVLRVHGKLLQAPYEEFTSEITRRLILQMLTHEQRRSLNERLELDFNYFLGKEYVFRVSLFHDLGTIAGAFHLLSHPFPSLASLELPPLVEGLTHMPSGLIFVNGPAGCGRDEIVAAMIDHINTNRSEHIVILENYSYYFHRNKMSVVHQREIGRDTLSASRALQSLPLQDVDVLVVETLYDLESMQTILSIADRGCLVIASMATCTATTTIGRFIQSFSEEEQVTVRRLMSHNLRGIICPQKVPMADGSGWVFATELMIATPDIRDLIRQSKTEQIAFVIEQSSRLGMQTIHQSLRDLYIAGKITRDMALARAMNRIELDTMLSESEAEQ